jgi:hypothetical protein
MAAAPLAGRACAPAVPIPLHGEPRPGAAAAPRRASPSTLPPPDSVPNPRSALSYLPHSPSPRGRSTTRRHGGAVAPLPVVAQARPAEPTDGAAAWWPPRRHAPARPIR